MEPGTGLTILGTAIGSAKLLEKLLGPTADYIGEGLSQWTQRRVNNVAAILINARDKLRNRLDSPGTIPPKVLMKVLEAGSFNDDELGTEYFGGVLASSKTCIARDDRGAAYLNTVTRLSAYQLRAHYIFYFLFRDLYRFRQLNLSRLHNLRSLPVFIPNDVLDTAMSFVEGENRFVILTHVMNGLVREDLIDGTRFFGSAEDISRYLARPVSSAGLMFRPSILGIELFLWAHGYGDVDMRGFLNEDLHIEPLAGIEIQKGAERGDAS